MKHFNLVFFSGAACGAIAGCFLGVWLCQPPSAEQERVALERQKAALQTTITALDTYYRMLTNGTLKPEKGQ